jgi:hypothetical protein
MRLAEPASNVKKTSVSAGHGVVVGLPGLEPGTSSLSAIQGLTPCGPAFSQVARERQGRSYPLLESQISELPTRSAPATSRFLGRRIVFRGAGVDRQMPRGPPPGGTAAVLGCRVSGRLPRATHSPQQGLGRISATITLAAPTTTRSVRVLLGAAGCALVACWPVERGQRGVFVPAAAPLPAPANSSATRV